MTPTDTNELTEPLWALWRDGQRPDVDAFLAQAGALAPAQVAAVLRVDQRERWQSGERVLAEHYLARHAAVRADREAALDLIFNECLLRERLGERPRIEEFADRFPEFADSLRDQMELHRAMGSLPNATAPSVELPSQDRETLPGSFGRNSATLPESFGRYRIVKVLGWGGMGTVYHAHDTQLERAVALKVPHFSEGVNEAVLIRFYREARIAATFTHPHLCPVFDVGEIDGTHYLTMPLLSGEPLAVWLRREGRLPTALAVRMTSHVARALAVAHAAGVVHRDLKPANIMVQDGPEFIVMDFGLARRSGPRDATATRSGVLIGTPAYLPPEQIGGDSTKAGPKSDIYSLGVILYEALAGRLPFLGSTDEVLKQVLIQVPEPIRRRRPDVDPRLEKICATAMAKDANERFASMTAFADALDEFAKLGPPKKWRLAWNRHRVWLAAVLIGVLSIGGTLAAIAFNWPNSATVDRVPDELQPGTRWEGVFRFAPPHDQLQDIVVTIAGRTGNEFVGEYATQKGAFHWAIAGAIEGGKTVRWKFTRAIKEPWPTGVVDNASVQGEILGSVMKVNFRDADSAVSMELRRRTAD
jgi:hypothetical protein